MGNAVQDEKDVAGAYKRIDELTSAIARLEKEFEDKARRLKQVEVGIRNGESTLRSVEEDGKKTVALWTNKRQEAETTAKSVIADLNKSVAGLEKKISDMHTELQEAKNTKKRELNQLIAEKQAEVELVERHMKARQATLDSVEKRLAEIRQFVNA